MCDVHLYYFLMSNSPDGDNMLSTQPATLEAIRDMGGCPIRESQMVVDHTELDEGGFLVAGLGCDSHVVNVIAA